MADVKKASIKTTPHAQSNTRNWLAQSYVELLRKWPDKKISISLICDNAGVGRQTFYRHFANKQDLLDYEFEKAQQQGWQIADSLPRPINIEDMIKMSFDIWMNRPYLQQLIHNADWQEWLNNRSMDSFRETYQRYFKPSEYDDYDTEIFIGAVNRVFHHWLRRDMQETPDELVTICKTFIDFSLRQGLDS